MEYYLIIIYKSFSDKYEIYNLNRYLFTKLAREKFSFQHETKKFQHGNKNKNNKKMLYKHRCTY